MTYCGGEKVTGASDRLQGGAVLRVGSPCRLKRNPNKKLWYEPIVRQKR